MGTYVDRRRLSTLEFYKQAVEIRRYVTQMVMNEKVVPKRWRFIHAIPIINLLHKWFSDMIIAKNIPKTRITKLSRGFTFLKTRFVLTKTGKVYLKTSREAITRTRRKLKKLKKFVDSGEISLDRARASFESIYGYMRQKDSYKVRCQLAALFYKLFNWRNEKWKT